MLLREENYFFASGNYSNILILESAFVQTLVQLMNSSSY